MTALALYAKELGISVSGSDVIGDFPTEDAITQGSIFVHNEFSGDNIPKKTDLLIYTGAHGGRDNPEVSHALNNGVAVISHGEALGLAMKGKRQISVAGCHGKTTTSAWIAYLLSKAGADPSWAIGAGMILPDILPGHAGKGGGFVAEADEYVTDPSHDKTPRFLWQEPEIALITNIDYDHPDVYASLADVMDAFRIFSQKARVVVVNNDDDASMQLVSSASFGDVVTYGCSNDAFFRISSVSFSSGRTHIGMTMGGSDIGTFEISVAGRHNTLNFAASLATCLRFGMNIEDVRKYSSGFIGTKRRCQIITTTDSFMIIDDYAHHPKEIQATLEAIHSWYPNRRIIAVFQPHTFSRTKALLSEFSSSFYYASTVVIGDIYSSARETDTLGVSAGDLVTRLVTNGKDARYGGSYEGTSKILRSIMKKDDIIVYMGAGDIYTWSSMFAKEL